MRTSAPFNGALAYKREDPSSFPSGQLSVHMFTPYHFAAGIRMLFNTRFQSKRIEELA